MAFAVAPEPKSQLGYYRQLAPNAGIKVSPLCLGGMSFGDKWKEGMGHMTKESTFELLDAFYEMGGNFIDVANNYHYGQSEEWLGEWLTSRKVRDDMVCATKFTTGYDENAKIRVNTTGNHMKSLHTSLKASLEKLQTDYIDLLYVHWWAYDAPIEEVMQSLNNVVKSGKVLYLGVSDTPAWLVAQANQYARDHGLAQFVVYQGKYSVTDRDIERDIIPMARAFGMGLCPWNAIGGGKFQTKKMIEERKKNNEGLRSIIGTSEQSELQVKASEALEKVAGELGIDSITSVALAYVMQKHPYVFPIVGGRKVEHLKDNLKALEISLTPEHIKTLDDVTSWSPGFPFDQFGKTNFLTSMNGHFRHVQAPQAIRPSQ